MLASESWWGNRKKRGEFGLFVCGDRELKRRDGVEDGWMDGRRRERQTPVVFGHIFLWLALQLFNTFQHLR